MNRLHYYSSRIWNVLNDRTRPYPRNWQFILKDSASVLDGVLEENEARKLINLQTKSTVTSHLVPAQ